MTKSILVFCIVFSFLTFNLNAQTEGHDQDSLISGIVQADEELDFELSDVDLDAIEEEELSLAEKTSLLIQFLKLKSYAVKNNAINHIKNNKTVYTSCAVIGGLTAATLITQYYLGERG